MITPLTPLPLPPTRQDPVNFAARADAFLAALPDFQVELNTLASELDSIGSNATQSEINAAQSASDAQDAANVAGAFANYKGLWSGLTGALNKPASVKHDNKYWFLLNDLPDVTASEPGVSPDWEESNVVRTSGAIFTGPVEVPAGASGNQVPRASEVALLTGATFSGPLTVPGATFTAPLEVPAGASGAEVPQAQEALLYETALIGLRNLLINPLFNINQRNYTSGTNTTSANQYTVDRWRVVTSGQNLQLFANGSGFEVLAPAGGVEQVVEGLNIHVATHTLSWTGNATATVDGNPVSNGGQVTLTPGTNATIRFSDGYVLSPQLEPGSKKTPMWPRPYGIELTLCHRYYFSGNVYWTGATTNGGRAGAQVWYPEPMRATPTVTTTITFANFFPNTNPTPFGSTNKGVTLDNIADSGGLDGRWSASFTASAEL